VNRDPHRLMNMALLVLIVFIAGVALAVAWMYGGQ
jgi:hypothetical protein